MRIWLLLLVVACAEPRRPPQPPPDDPGGISGCRSSPTLGGVRYDCTNYVIHDTTFASALVHTVGMEITSSARKKGIETSSRDLEIKGAQNAMVIEARQHGRYGLDVLAMTLVGTRSRMLQCHVDWFDSPRSISARENTCANTISILLERPAPPAPAVSAECTRATEHLSTLPSSGGPEEEEGRIVLRDFALRCTDTLAACVLASKTYVEATLCKE